MVKLFLKGENHEKFAHQQWLFLAKFDFLDPDPGGDLNTDPPGIRNTVGR